MGTSQWVTTVKGYDAKGRVVWIKTSNPFLGTTEILEHDLDFTGKIKINKTTHKKTGKIDIVVRDYFMYDHMKRLTKHTQSINESVQERIAEYTYDDLGQLETKGIGNLSSNNNRLQDINYQYNIRGWLIGINDIDNIGNDLFALELSYNNTELNASVPLYNGSISEAMWLTANDKIASFNNTSRAYSYNYDGLNRLVDAEYFQNEAKPYITKYDMKTAYDKNGNLTKLSRGRSYGTIDDLKYNYNFNQLIEVVDSGYSGSKAEGFVDDGIAGNDYTYDHNGNLISDANKGITRVKYNHLNMPTEIKFNGSNYQKINYIYSANGIKQRKITNDNGNFTTTDYAGNFVYENGILKQFSHPEGYIEPDGNGGYDYVYSYLDHLGNVRLTYADLDGNGSINASTEILQERNYYPFGLEHKGYNSIIRGTENDYKQFQGQEWTEDLGLNIHEWKYRVSDPAIGRFWQVDPLAEKYVWMTTYQFSSNQPIHAPELEGLESAWDLNSRDPNLQNRTPQEMEAFHRGEALGLATVVAIATLFTPTQADDAAIGGLLFKGASAALDVASQAAAGGDIDLVGPALNFAPMGPMSKEAFDAMVDISPDGTVSTPLISTEGKANKTTTEVVVDFVVGAASNKAQSKIPSEVTNVATGRIVTEGVVNGAENIGGEAIKKEMAKDPEDRP